MSFGLLTAINITDVPYILRRVARTYRNVDTRQYKRAWIAAAELLEIAADELVPVIEEVKRTEPRPRRARQRF